MLFCRVGLSVVTIRVFLFLSPKGTVEVVLLIIVSRDMIVFRKVRLLVQTRTRFVEGW
jgi:hypothetical protein